jgi:hypothetical protein
MIEARVRGDDVLANHRYYRECAGVWRSDVSMTITDTGEFSRSGMRLADRVSLRLMAIWPPFLGRILLCTTVAYDAGGQVLHTTVVRWLGIPLRRSVEAIALDRDGRRFAVRGGMTGTGTVDEAGTCASYELDWLGVRILQSTRRERDVVTVRQQGPGFSGAQTLLRQRAD